jgi:MATE family multidrug resistance protein
MAPCSITICLLRYQMAGLFVHDPAVIALSAQLLLITGIFQVFDGLQVASMGALRGMEDVQIPTLIILFCYWLICLPTAYYVCFGLHWGAQGVWLSMLLGLVFASITLVWRLETRFKLRLSSPA